MTTRITLPLGVPRIFTAKISESPFFEDRASHWKIRGHVPRVDDHRVLSLKEQSWLLVDIPDDPDYFGGTPVRNRKTACFEALVLEPHFAQILRLLLATVEAPVLGVQNPCSFRCWNQECGSKRVLERLAQALWLKVVRGDCEAMRPAMAVLIEVMSPIVKLVQPARCLYKRGTVV